MKQKVICFFEKIFKNNFLFYLNCFVFFLRFKFHFTKKITPSRISLINSHDYSGGAAKVATTILDNLINEYEVKLFVKTSKTNKKGVVKITNLRPTFISELLRRIAIKNGWLEFSGFDSLTLKFDPFYKKSEIVHLHNLHGEFFSPVLFSILLKNKRVIWTLHDERLITGHCSCTLGCLNWKTGCGNCPDLEIYPPVLIDQTHEVLKETRRLVNKLQPIIVCPSHWLAERVRHAYPDIRKIDVIPNGIDTSIFFPRDKEKSRKELGFQLDKKIVLFIAEFSTLNPFKGGNIFRSIIADPYFSDIQFVTVGGSNKSEYINHTSYSYVSDEVELAKLYTACDILLYPTQADNFPLVVLESMACGTPVIASRIGGIPEIINSDQIGYLVDNYKDEYMFKEQLNKFFEMGLDQIKSMSFQVSERIKNNYSLQHMLSKYRNLYDSN